jgi:hypothetical protein
MTTLFTSLKQASFVLFVAIATIVSANAQTTTFQGQMYDLWSNTANWSDGVPQKGMTAIIPGGTGVSMDQTLTVDFTLQATGHVSVLKGVIVTFENAQTFESVSNAGQMVFQSDATINKSFNNLGTIKNNGSMISNGIITNQRAIINTGLFQNGGQFINTGSVSSMGAIHNQGHWNNAKGAVVAITEGSIYFDETSQEGELATAR